MRLAKPSSMEVEAADPQHDKTLLRVATLERQRAIVWHDASVSHNLKRKRKTVAGMGQQQDTLIGI